jgi:hypothetical protein
MPGLAKQISGDILYAKEDDMKYIRQLMIAVGILSAIVLFSWIYTTLQLNHASSDGVFDSAELAMQVLIDKGYAPDHDVKILYAGTNSFDGSKPYIWYVIAEVRASSRADGSSLNKNGCDAPGSFFLQTKEGWVHMPEGAFPVLIGFWMDAFDLAGPGQAESSTNWAADQPPQFCLE